MSVLYVPGKRNIYYLMYRSHFVTSVERCCVIRIGTNAILHESLFFKETLRNCFISCTAIEVAVNKVYIYVTIITFIVIYILIRVLSYCNDVLCF